MRVMTLDTPTLEKLIAAAVTAPSLHNTQPWRFRFVPTTRTVLIRVATDRGLRHADPSGRAVHLSVGCAVLNLRVAVAHFGWEPVTRLLPRPGQPDLLASVRLADTARTTSPAGLYEALWRRRSSRFPFSDRPLPSDLLWQLAEAAHVEGAWLDVLDSRKADHVLHTTWAAEGRNRTDTDRATESRYWTSGPHPDSLGLPPVVLGPQDALDRIPMRDFGVHRSPAALPARPYERQPALVVLRTAHDRRTDWLRSGQALERVLLVATAHGVRSSLMHQALEWDDLRARLDRRLDDARRGHTQMVIRLGYGPEGSASPRRDVNEAMDGIVG
ncbi:nitroreductase family protein [Streptomyces sp. NPDC005481]|uniref:Acg family FMN-binding oxidoreductase n=1 Tax=Streptomyces sp. NPDC005481 TaxID=3154881 RepID=UPI0033B31B98